MSCHECVGSSYWQEGRTTRAWAGVVALGVLSTAAVLGGCVYTNSPQAWHPDTAMEAAVTQAERIRGGHAETCHAGLTCETCRTLTRAVADAMKVRTELIKSYTYRPIDRIARNGLDMAGDGR